jgi:AraC family transcriptional regulator
MPGGAPQSFIATPPILGDPDGMSTVSAAARVLWDSGSVGWQGALFTELLAAPAGSVDHAHAHYCLRRTLSAYRRRTDPHDPWTWVPAGDWWVWRPGEAQRSEWRGGGRRHVLFLSPARVEEVIDGKPPPDELDRSSRPDVAPVVERLLDAMAADLATGSAAGPLVGDCLVTALCMALFAPTSRVSRFGGLVSNARQRVIDRIEHGLDGQISLPELAAETGLGVRQFSRAFRVSIGVSPYQYVLEQRIERAKHLIGGGTPLAEVALRCGFGGQSQLTRVFTRRIGLSPAAYRRTIAR